MKLLLENWRQYVLFENIAKTNKPARSNKAKQIKNIHKKADKAKAARKKKK